MTPVPGAGRMNTLAVQGLVHGLAGAAGSGAFKEVDDDGFIFLFLYIAILYIF